MSALLPNAGHVWSIPAPLFTARKPDGEWGQKSGNFLPQIGRTNFSLLADCFSSNQEVLAPWGVFTAVVMRLSNSTSNAVSTDAAIDIPSANNELLRVLA
jgi:hypothetical protein